MSRPYNVLFLCTGNSARSILAESILRKDGAGKFNAFSAGSRPKPDVNPLALRTLRNADYPTDGCAQKLRKSSQVQVRRRWISCLPFAMAQPVKPVRYGPVILLPRIGGLRTRRCRGKGNRKADGVRDGVPLPQESDFRFRGAPAGKLRPHVAQASVRPNRRWRSRS